ncbi:hypothetical protein M569_15381 [Genlisea aurea]|uniref:C2 domain-containing protein n=1 Tax=Genlisea aurea TaxID=192259 RepID=S8D9T9_9LAMI|nr:hypothetical protein M569_15381 [Genlisea aurea]
MATEYRPLKINLISAEGLKDVKLIGKMDLYAEVSLAGYPQSNKKSYVDKNSGPNPKWNFKTEFVVDEPYLTKPGLTLLVQIMDEGTFNDKVVGSVSVPVHELFRGGDSHEDRVVEYQVHTQSGKPKGTLKFSYRFGEKFSQPKIEAANQPQTAYPAAVPYPAPGGYAGPSQGVGYPPPQYAQQPYPQPGGGYAYPQPPAGYGYPPSGYGYPQPYAQPPQYAQQPRKNGMGGMGGMGGVGLGLGAGLLGGLLLGEVASDIGEQAAYADGYDDAMGGDMGF